MLFSSIESSYLGIIDVGMHPKCFDLNLSCAVTVVRFLTVGPQN